MRVKEWRLEDARRVRVTITDMTDEEVALLRSLKSPNGISRLEGGVWEGSWVINWTYVKSVHGKYDLPAPAATPSSRRSPRVPTSEVQRILAPLFESPP